jgi:hypothetical protein
MQWWWWLPLLVWLWHQFDTFSEVVPRERIYHRGGPSAMRNNHDHVSRHAGRARQDSTQGLGFIPQFAARQATKRRLLNQSLDHYVRVLTLSFIKLLLSQLLL